MIGTTVGTRFHIVSRIGDGWLFSVYRARDQLTGQLVVVKIVRPTFATLRPFVMALQQAIDHVIGLAHPSLVRYLAVGETDTDHALFLVCELVAGHDLAQLLQRRLPLPVSQALQLLTQIADGLAYLHRVGLVHGDLRPHNVLVMPRGEAKVGDYALWSAFLTSRVAETEWMERAAPYLAPERFQGDEATPQSDIYGLGVLLYQMVTGHLPFEAATVADLAHQHLTAPVPLASSLNPSVPFSVDAILLRAMAKDPTQRFDSVDTLRSAVQEALALLETQSISSLLSSTAEPSLSTEESSTDSDHKGATNVWRRWLGQSMASLVLVFIGALLSLTVVLFALYYLLVGTKPEEVVVPDVTGMKLRQAQRVLEERGLQLRVVRWEFSKDFPPEYIIRMEDPEPNRRVLEGREVLVVASQGVARTTVPDLKGKSVKEALAALESAKLRLGQRVDAYSETMPAGTVIGQQPPPLVEVPEETPVNFIVSKGAPPSEPEINWEQTPPDAKVARVSIHVGGTQIRQVVQIIVRDEQGEREVYRSVHVPGDRITRTVIVRGTGNIRVLVNGEVVHEEGL